MSITKWNRCGKYGAMDTNIECLLCREKGIWKYFRVGLSPSKNFLFIHFNESPLKLKKIAFYFMLKALFVLGIIPLLF